MAVDKLERGYTKPSKKKRVEPFVLIPSEVLISTAYIDLSFSASSMLVEVLHFYNGRNNGCIWISPEVLRARRFSKNTASKALKELRSHGFIYMTKRGGNQRGGCSWFAITWLPINRVDGQFLGQFIAKAYESWEGAKEKIKGAKNRRGNPKKRELLDKVSLNGQYLEINVNTRECLNESVQIPNIVTYKDMPSSGIKVKRVE